MEIKFLKQTGSDIYSFEIKEKYEQFVSYAPLDDAVLRGEVEALALGSYLTLGCRDAARADIRLDSAGRPSFMEINTLPGLHPIHSDLPIIARQEGMSYTELIGAIISSAMQRIVK
jgi:D-alanine-D-alanine ligase